jgi:hypothetical protein
MPPTPPCRVTLIKPNRLSTAGLLFERNVETEVPLRIFHKLYRERQRQFDFAPEGIALMMRAPASDLAPAVDEPDDDPDPDTPAETRTDAAKPGFKVIRKPRAGDSRPVENPGQNDEAGVDV